MMHRCGRRNSETPHNTNDSLWFIYSFICWDSLSWLYGTCAESESSPVAFAGLIIVKGSNRFGWSLWFVHWVTGTSPKHPPPTSPIPSPLLPCTQSHLINILGVFRGLDQKFRSKTYSHINILKSINCGAPNSCSCVDVFLGIFLLFLQNIDMLRIKMCADIVFV